MSEEKIKDMLLKQCLELTTNNDFRPPISAYNGVDIDDVVRACKQLQDKKTYIDLVKENESLKKQLEEKNKIGISDHKYASKCEDKVITMENQQKEFIKYLENMLDNENDIFSVVRVKDVLSKYKEIIGE